MKKIAYIIFIIICLLATNQVFSQQFSCGHDAYIEEKLKDPLFAKQLEENRRKRNVMVRRRSDPTGPCTNPLIIPVAVHYNGDVNALDKACLVNAAEAQVEQLNLDFSSCNVNAHKLCEWINEGCTNFGGTRGADAMPSDGACIQFCLADQNLPAGEDNIWGYGITVGDYRFSGNNGDAPPWAGCLNLFVENSITETNITGVAVIEGAADPRGNGAYIRADVFGGNKFGGCFSGTKIGTNIDYSGSTGTHELGHYFGLYHTFDKTVPQLPDIPPQSEPNSRCPTTINTNICETTVGKDFSGNFMDYLSSVCMSNFSADQVAIMNDVAAPQSAWRTDMISCWAGWQNGTKKYNSCVQGPCRITTPPEANFSTNLLCDDGISIEITDLSKNAPTSWTWEFSGAGVSPVNSVEQNPTITVSSTGILNIKLVAKNDYGEDTTNQDISVSVLGIDTDNDGIVDDCDVDDDNDGILDSEELAPCATPARLTNKENIVVSSLISFEESLLNLIDNSFFTFARPSVNRRPIDGTIFLNFDFQEPITLLAIELAAHQNGVFVNRSVFIVEGSNDDNTWIPLTDKIVSEGLKIGVVTGFPYSENFPFEDNQEAYRYYRLRSILGTTKGYLREANFQYITFDSLTFCDTDNDGISNHLDLDSDNDNCPDAVEGEADFLMNDLNQQGTLCNESGCVDSNGLPINNGLPQEIGTAYDRTLTSGDCEKICIGTIDTDGDGIANECDLDDDNDGILDTEELLHCRITDYKAIVDITSDLSFSSSFSYLINNIFDDWVYANTYGAPIKDKAYLAFDFQSPAILTAIEIATDETGALQRGAVLVVQGSEDGIDWKDVSERITTSGLKKGILTNYDTAENFSFEENETAYRYYRLWGISGNTIDYYLREISFKMSPIEILFCDTDGDGVSNELDLDSDSDGCPDALEGKANFSKAYVDEEGRLLGEVNEQGIPIVEHIPQVKGTAYTDLLVGDACCKGTLDTDGDGIPDLCDLDDDNDGILDNVECKTIYTNTEIADIASKNKLIYDEWHAPGCYTDQIAYNVNNPHIGIIGFRTQPKEGYGAIVEPIARANGGAFSNVLRDQVEPSFYSNTKEILFSDIATLACISGWRIVTGYFHIPEDIDDDFTIRLDMLGISNHGLYLGTTDGAKYNAVQGIWDINNDGKVDRITNLTSNFEDLELVGDVSTEQPIGQEAEVFFIDKSQAGKLVAFGIVSTEQGIYGQLKMTLSHAASLVPETSVTPTTDCDYDNDGIPNHLDLDSDDDGCPDAIEGADDFDYKDLDNEDKLDSDVDETGVPTVDGSPQQKGTTYDETQSPPECEPGCIGTIDSDNDGVDDECDFDDDNDGILDIDEGLCEGGELSDCTESEDYDNDGIPNHLDLDSDNDGCPDAIEGADDFSYNDLDNDDRLNSNVDDDGVPTINGSPQQEGIAYDEIQFPVECEQNCIGTIDSDNDGVDDECDLDDDNDGILDTDEGLCEGELVSATYPSCISVIDWSSITENLTGGGTFHSDVLGQVTVSGDANSDIRIGTRNNGGRYLNFLNHSHTIVLSWENPISGFVLPLGDLDFNENVTLVADGATFSPISLGPTDSWTPPNRLSGSGNNLNSQADNFSPIQVSAPNGITQIALSYGTISANGVNSLLNICITEATISDCTESEDYDNDGIPNHLDPDSDNDGCPDAIEGAGSFTWEDLTDVDNLCNKPSCVNKQNGLPINDDVPQSIGDSQDASVQNDNCCDISIIASELSDCNDNGTSSNPNDDYYTLTITANGKGVGNQYEVVMGANADGTGGIALGAQNYDTPITIGDGINGESDILLANNIYTIVIRDMENPSCNDSFSTRSIPSCSSDCQISIALDPPIYNDNNTPEDLTDDTFTFGLVVNNNPADMAGWQGGGKSGAYGEKVVFGPYPVDEGGASFSIGDVLSGGNCRVGVSVNMPSCVYTGDCVCCK